MKSVPYRTEVVNGHKFEWVSTLFRSSVGNDYFRDEHRLDGKRVSRRAFYTALQGTRAAAPYRGLGFPSSGSSDFDCHWILR